MQFLKHCKVTCLRQCHCNEFVENNSRQLAPFKKKVLLVIFNVFQHAVTAFLNMRKYKIHFLSTFSLLK